jgi:hypothetical protein
MKMMLRLRTIRGLAWSLMALTALPYVASGAMAAQVTSSAAQTVLLFPMDSPDSASAQVAKGLTSMLESGLSASPAYRVIRYSERLPSVQRLVNMQSDSKMNGAGPFASDPTAIAYAVEIGKAMSVDQVVVGSVDKYTVSQDKPAELMATVMVVDVRTGKTLKTIVVTGKGATSDAGQTLAGGVRVSAVVADAGNKILADLVVTTSNMGAPAPPTVQKPPAKNSSWLVVLLLAVGAGLLLSHSGGGSSSNSDNPPPPPF